MCCMYMQALLELFYANEGKTYLRADYSLLSGEHIMIVITFSSVLAIRMVLLIYLR